MRCPRQDEVPPGPYRDAVSTWTDRDGARACSFCGSMHPDDLFAAIERGEELVPTDKSYKVYVGKTEHRKFYFQHLSDDERSRFVQVLNERRINIGYPGHFYVLPFFVRGQ